MILSAYDYLKILFQGERLVEKEPKKMKVRMKLRSGVVNRLVSNF